MDNVNVESPIDLGNVNNTLYVDVDIDENEIRKAVTCKCLKSGKANGIDGVLNEYITSSWNMFLPVYKLLFNRILSSGVIPTDWLIGIVIAILKKNGSEFDVNTYIISHF